MSRSLFADGSETSKHQRSTSTIVFSVLEVLAGDVMARVDAAAVAKGISRDRINET